MSIADTGSLDSSVKLRVAGNLQLGSDNSGGAITKIYESSGLNLDSGSSSRPIYFRINGTEKLKIETSGNATFAGDISIADKLIHSGDTNTYLSFSGADNIKLVASGKNVLHAHDNGNLYLYGNNGTALTLDGSQNATFAGKIIADQGVQFTGGTIAAATTVLHTNNVVYARGGSGGMFLQNSDGSDGIFIANDHVRFDAGGSEKMRINTAGAVIINATAVRESASKLSVQGGMSEFETTLTNNEDWANSPISILERANIGSGSTADKYAPNLNFHWGGVTSKSLWMGADGHLSFGEYSSNGTPTADGTFLVNTIGVGTTSPTYKLDVNGGIQAGGKVTYTKSAGSLDTTGYAVAGLTTSSNGQSAGFTFTCFGHTGGYQKIVYSCYNGSGTWVTKKVINEGTNQLDVVASANGTTITFTFKSISGTMSYTPRVTVEAVGTAINSTYA